MILTVTTYTEAGTRVMHIWRNGGTLCFARFPLGGGAVSIRTADLLNLGALLWRIKRTVGYNLLPMRRLLSYVVASGRIEDYSIFVEV